MDWMERIMTRGYLLGKSCWYVKSLLLALAIFAPASNAAWVENSPAGVEVTDFALAPSEPRIVLATTAGAFKGIWTSSVSGTGGTWTQQEVTPGYNGAAIKADNFNFMLAGVLNGKIRVSSDGGVAWGADIPSSASHSSWIIEFSPLEFDTVYAAGYTSGAPDTGILQKSTNANATSINVVWDSFAIGGDLNPPTFSLAIAPTDANTVYVGAQPSGAANGLYKTINGAINWNYLSALNFTRVDAIAVDPVDLNFVYAGTGVSGQIQRSSDGGVSWVTLHDPSNGGVAGFTSVRGLAINPANRRIIYAVGGSGTTKVIVSTDCGASWSNVDATGLTFGLPDKVVIDPLNDFVMVRTNTGLNTGFMYREALLTTATGACDANTGFPSSGGGGSSFDYLLLGMLMLIGVAKYRTRPVCRVDQS
jgi:hypothetical protein